MSPGIAVFILMNNYFHDVATAMLMACSGVMWIVVRRHGQHGSPDSRAFLLRLYRGISRAVMASWIWIVASGVLRILTFRSFEWALAVERNQQNGLIIKYLMALGMIAGGTYLWMMLAVRVREIKEIDAGQ